MHELGNLFGSFAFLHVAGYLGLHKAQGHVFRGQGMGKSAAIRPWRFAHVSIPEALISREVASPLVQEGTRPRIRFIHYGGIISKMRREIPPNPLCERRAGGI